MLGEEEKKREKVGRRKEIEEGLKKKRRKKKIHPGILHLPPTLLPSLFHTFFLSVAAHKTSSSAITAT